MREPQVRSTMTVTEGRRACSRILKCCFLYTRHTVMLTDHNADT